MSNLARRLQVCLALALSLFAVPARAQVSNFSTDVASSIDRGEWSIVTN